MLVRVQRTDLASTIKPVILDRHSERMTITEAHSGADSRLTEQGQNVVNVNIQAKVEREALVQADRGKKLVMRVGQNIHQGQIGSRPGNTKLANCGMLVALQKGRVPAFNLGNPACLQFGLKKFIHYLGIVDGRVPRRLTMLERETDGVWRDRRAHDRTLGDRGTPSRNK
ncbi:hypothetical protein AK812_SmicGene13432 [Symbiodinium microadriaticum]|uniref:Uncharacterized protein n=1 Tax=Symbiodinium microadriaticum TaxID=2951 RepID=A0A1Q9E867_SYMMI|nr:hypothetical protein AK812_SmicGene13432 [Symbiodinium microadriaticum]